MVPDMDSSPEDYEDWNLRTQFQYTISNSGNYMDSLLMRVFIVNFFLSNRIWASLLWIPLLTPQWSTQFFPNARSNLSLYIFPLNRWNAVLYTSWCNSGGWRITSEIALPLKGLYLLKESLFFILNIISLCWCDIRLQFPSTIPNLIKLVIFDGFFNSGADLSSLIIPYEALWKKSKQHSQIVLLYW